MSVALLLGGTLFFLHRRSCLYQQAAGIVRQYMDGDFSSHLPQNQEGDLFQLFSEIEQLSTMLQSKNEAEHKNKEFLKFTISDISHQLKTPLAALMMYQESWRVSRRTRTRYGSLPARWGRPSSAWSS